MRYLTFSEVILLHERVIATSGGSLGLRDLGTLLSALAQPHATFDGEDLYGSLEEKAAALGFSLVSNHPFVDGNKRIGHAVMEVFLVLNGCELAAGVDEQERVILDLAAGQLPRDEFFAWVKANVRRAAG